MKRLSLGCLGLTLALAGAVTAQDVVVRGLEEAESDLRWTEWVSDVPLVDLTGLWEFLPAHSDPMVETWRERAVSYEISQQTDRIVLAFRPENGEPNVQEYRWDGTVNSFQRGAAEVRERARWTRGGRALEIEGRWWPVDDRSAMTSYSFLYVLDANRRLVFHQRDDHGATVWRFGR